MLQEIKEILHNILNTKNEIVEIKTIHKGIEEMLISNYKLSDEKARNI